MGFITTGNTEIVVYLTHIGAEYLAGKKNSDKDLIIKYFSLGDSDSNYLVQKRLGKGLIPDLTGEDPSCLKLVNYNIRNSDVDNVFHRYPIERDGDSTTTISTTYYSKELSLSGSRSDCGSDSHGSIVTYYVEAKKYTSKISQADADSKANLDLTTNGNVYILSNSVCSVWNAEQSQVVTRSNCGSGNTGSTVTYTVPAHTYDGNTLAEANQKALDDITMNAQTYANTNGACNQVIFWNVEKSQDFTKNDCAAGSSGTVVTYTVPIHTVSGSTQTIADNNALALVSSNGQTNANTNGTCVVDPVYTFNKTADFQKNDCTVTGATGSILTYSKQYSSTVSQADAESQATADNSIFMSSGQTNANTNGICNNPLPSDAKGIIVVDIYNANGLDAFGYIDSPAVTTAYQIPFYKNGYNFLPNDSTPAKNCWGLASDLVSGGGNLSYRFEFNIARMLNTYPLETQFIMRIKGRGTSPGVLNGQYSLKGADSGNMIMTGGVGSYVPSTENTNSLGIIPYSSMTYVGGADGINIGMAYGEVIMTITYDVGTKAITLS